jgi:altronate dehydratase small subunit
MKGKRALALNPKDNLAVALENIQAEDEVTVQTRGGQSRSIRAVQNIPFGFKVSLGNIAAGQFVFKYGETIGQATRDIKIGEQVHIHNIQGVRVQGEGKKGEKS